MTSVDIPLERSVPLPKNRYPWRDMEVGSSFFVPGRTSRTFRAHVQFGRRATGFRFVTRTEFNDHAVRGVRVWRIA